MDPSVEMVLTHPSPNTHTSQAKVSTSTGFVSRIAVQVWSMIQATEIGSCSVWYEVNQIYQSSLTIIC